MGLLTAAAKLASKSLRNLGDDSMRGAYISGVPNYIKGHYGPTEAAKEAGTGAILREKAGGLLSTGYEGIKNAIKMQMPYNRAVYSDTGLNLPLMQSPKQTSSNRTMQEELAARAQFNRHTSEQTGRKGDNVLDEVMERAAYTKYIPMKKGFYDVANQFNKGTSKQTITPDESAKLEDYMSRIWRTKSLMDKIKSKPGEELGFKRNNKFILKRPQGTISGNHWHDMINRSAFSSVARDIFGKKMENPTSVDELADKLSKIKWTVTDKWGKKQTITGVPGIEKDKDGVWFSFSKVGSAITEGGANFRVKIKPDGIGFGVMSDEHNFLEFLPGMSTKLRNKVLAATPPMHFNIKSARPMQTGGAKKKRGRPAKTNKYGNKSWQEFGPEGNQNLESFLNTQKPSASTLMKERLKASGKVGLLGLGANAFSSPEL